MDIIAAKDRHPDHSDGMTRHCPIWTQPPSLVIVGGVYNHPVNHNLKHGQGGVWASELTCSQFHTSSRRYIRWL